MTSLKKQEIEIDEIEKYLLNYPNGRWAIKGIFLEQCNQYEHRLGERFHIEKEKLGSLRYRICIMNNHAEREGQNA